MIINSVIGKVDGLEIDLKLSDGVNFIFYTDKSGVNFIFYTDKRKRLLYEKIFRLAFDEYYYADDFYENHDIELEFNMKCSIDCKLHYKTYTISVIAMSLFQSVLSNSYTVSVKICHIHNTAVSVPKKVQSSAIIIK